MVDQAEGGAADLVDGERGRGGLEEPEAVELGGSVTAVAFFGSAGQLAGWSESRVMVASATAVSRQSWSRTFDGWLPAEGR